MGTHRNDSDPTASTALGTTGPSSTCLPAPAPHMLLHPFTSHTVSFPQWPQHCVVPQWAANPPAGPCQTHFLLRLQLFARVTVPNKLISVVCLFLIPVEALTQGNLWGNANDQHVWDGPQQGVMDCPLGSAQLNKSLPSLCQPG